MGVPLKPDGTAAAVQSPRLGRRGSIAGMVAAAGSALLPRGIGAQTTQTITDTNVADGLTLALGGDLLLAEAVPTTSRTQPVLDLIGRADIALANLEVPIVDIRPGRVQPANTGYLLTLSPPEVAEYLKQTGFHLLSFANNHTLDWGVEGARETVRRVNAAGMSAAGFGETRSAARAPVFRTTPKGRVGLMALTSSFWPGWVAADPLGVIPGVAGVSALRTVRTEIVTREQFTTLKQIDAQHNSFETILPPPGGDNLVFRGVRFRPGDRPDTIYDMNSDDVADILRNIRQAKQQSDFLVVSMHNHEQPGCDNPIASGDGSAWRCQKSVDFMARLARMAIDNGADVFMGHGPHVLLGIEVYKGRPILYSLGNLYAQSEAITQFRDAFPAGMDGRKDTVPEFSEKFWALYKQDSTMEESVVAQATFSNNALAELRLHPVDLGAKRRLSNRGTPELASPEMSQRILGRLQDMSRPYGTQIVIEGNTGVIRV